MTTLNIPSSPSQGATYEANGVVYTWDGTKWKADSNYVSNLNGGQLAGFRNQLINGDFRVWQRGGVFSNLTALNSGIEYTADHVYVSTISASSGQIEFDRGSVTGLEGFAGCLQNNTNALAYVSFPVELDRLGGFASPFIVGKTYTASWYQTDSTQLGNNLQFKVSSDASTYTSECTEVGALKAESTGVGTWTRYSQSFTMVDPSGASPTLLALTVLVGAGNSITGVQLEPGPVATPFEHRPIGTELALCQRYFHNLNEINPSGVGPVGLMQAQNVSRMVCYLPTKVPMRTAPTVALPTTPQYQLQVNDSSFGGINFATDQSCQTGVFIIASPDPGNANRFTVGGSGRLFTADVSAKPFTADAEL